MLIKKFFYYLLFTILVLFLIEFITRVLIFIPTNNKVFKYGLNKNIIFEVVDLSKLQINITDRNINNYKKKVQKNNPQEKILNAWAFGGSTTFGHVCGESSSWVKELNKINNKLNVKNFAFNGADSDQLIAILWRSLEKKQEPEIILWASKFNMPNMMFKNDYRNKKILNYEFTNVNKTKFFLFIKRIDKSLKSYLLSYSLLDAIILRLNFNRNLYKKEFTTDKDIEMMVKNFELNTNEAIELSKSRGVKEFYIVSLFSTEDFNNKKPYKFSLYEDYLNRASRKYSNFVKIIDLTKNLLTENETYYLCDNVHQNLQGNIFQAKEINNFIEKNSKQLN